MSTKFLKDFNKSSEKIPGISVASKAPEFWISSGNFVINKVLSGNYLKGVPQGRLSMIAGPSGAGKSFLCGNMAVAALNQGFGVLAIDSENALDDAFMTALGADIDNPNYVYRGVQTIPQCTKVVQSFIKGYRSARESGENIPPFLIVIDSLDMLQTSSDADKYDRGEIGGDQGQHAKQIKKMLGAFVQDTKNVDIHIICTKQVYQEQDPIAAKQMPWRITESLRFAFSQILLVTKLMLKDDTTKAFEGIKLKAYGFKTRFCKPFQTVTIEVPYDTGMDPYSGLLEAAVAVGVVESNGAWYEFEGNKFQKKKFEDYREQVLEKMVTMHESERVDVAIEEEEDLSEAKNHTEIRVERVTRKRKKKDESEDAE